MDFYIADFIKGLNDALTKKADEASVFDVQGSVFPNISSQSKWHFARTNDHLHLNDGSNVYCFHLPEGEKEYDFPVTKLQDSALHEFGKDAKMQGIVQVHRADPGSIYFTMQDGHKNPTYTFKHITGAGWRAIPKVKTCASPTCVDKEAFIKGAEGAASAILDTILKGIDGAGRAGVRGTMALGHDPMLSAGAGLLGGAAYDIGKRTLYNTDEENEQETAVDRLKRYLVPSAALGVVGSAAKSTFPNYYSEYPQHTP